MKALKQYITTGTRHKLLFISCTTDALSFIDIGALLSEAIEPHLQKKRLSLIAEEALDKIIEQNTFSDPDIGDYIAIKNIGILFEPALGLNVHSKFDSWARTHVLIVHNEGIIKNNVFYLAGVPDQHYSIILTDISYKTLSDEI
ncbi:hypothetical protein [Parabacteroides pacaensis]|uniref:hypothetical protein n=1 Tax=Parabacteroides pacaensis TaxID=2086575 RepID=UPI000D0FC840|nr:hypothetical protein [Parabacteroides pacaensis]